MTMLSRPRLKPSEKIAALRAALKGMMAAYERRIRSDCKTPEDLEKEPWRCAEYIAAAEALKINLTFSHAAFHRLMESVPDEGEP